MSPAPESDARDEGFDDFLDAIAAGDPYYLECANGHGSLPPRRACPECGDRSLRTEPLPEPGEIVTYTVTHVSLPAFADDTPYATAIADFGPVRLTGVVYGVEPDGVETGQAVEAAVGESAANGERFVALQVTSA